MIMNLTQELGSPLIRIWYERLGISNRRCELVNILPPTFCHANAPLVTVEFQGFATTSWIKKSITPKSIQLSQSLANDVNYI